MTSKDNICSNDLGYILSILLLRLWLAVRAFQTGIEKFAGRKPVDSTVLVDGAPNTYGLTESTATKVYAMSNYNGVPAQLYDKFIDEPLIPEFALNIYNVVLRPGPHYPWPYTFYRDRHSLLALFNGYNLHQPHIWSHSNQTRCGHCLAGCAHNHDSYGARTCEIQQVYYSQ